MLEHCTVVEHTIPGNHIRHYAKSTATRQEDVLHLAVKQYRPRYEARDGDVTILACHASAFPKELYEPMWDCLFARAASKAAGHRIRAVWIADVVNQGQSGMLNEGKLGNEPSWYDHARDYLHLVNHFRQDMIRPLVGFGHSMGGNVIVNLALLHPRLLTTIVAVEPILTKSMAGMDFVGAYLLTMKKDKWPSREAAMASISKSPFYAHWDPQVLDIFQREGLRDLPTMLYPHEPPHSRDTVTLATTKHQEAATFARKAFPQSRDAPLSTFAPQRTEHPDLGAERNPSHAFYRPENVLTYQQLPLLRPSCYYIYGSRSHFQSAQAAGRKDKRDVTGVATGGSGGVAEGRVKDVVTPGSHFVPFEQPAVVAELAGQWFDDELEKWQLVEAEETQAWNAVPPARRAALDEDWMHWVTKIYGSRTSGPGKGKSSKSPDVKGKL